MTMSLNYLQRPDGRIAYDAATATAGPLVVCVAGMADLRSTYRHLTPALTGAGFRVAAMELRGHGDSDTTFEAYDDEAAASDIVALVEELGAPAVLIGHSMGAAAAIIAAARRPELVSGLVLVGPFARDPQVGPLVRGLLRLAMQPLWIRAVWRAWVPTLYAGRRPDDFDEHLAAMVDAIGRPGHRRALHATTRTTHRPAAELIGTVESPALVVMGELDKDFDDPAAEAGWVAEQLGGPAQVLMVPEAGHYPHAQRPDLVAPAVTAFVREVTDGTPAVRG
jgi:pimeloyl-ACP methyl ester carboxylesterase